MTSIYLGVVLGVIVGGVVGFVAGRRTGRPAARFVAENDDVLAAAHAALGERTERRLERIMASAREAGRITNDGVEDLFCISDRTASVYLRQLKEAGRLERRGRGRGTYYVPTGK